jgi:hypothetical protein
MSPAFGRLILASKRLSMIPGFLNDDMALSAYCVEKLGFRG